ncbi:MAG TPA: hypothetical protein VH165_34965 [Kofleriaceae bacterium]|nr:hypothetical protein [Kofleriaceae bacterium]
MIDARSADDVARALAAACRDPDVLARLGGPIGAAARAAHATQPDRKARLHWAMAARTPVPKGLRGVHPSWIEAGLAGLPVRSRAAVAAGGGTPVDTWLARWATAGIPPMPAVTAARVASADDATRVDAATLIRWLEDAGADQLAFALGAADPRAVAAAARIVGDQLTAAAARITRAPRAGALGPIRAAIARCRVELDEHALLRIGARGVAPHVDPLARLQMMHRVPRALGLVIGDELAAAAHASIADAPRWDALAAP